VDRFEMLTTFVAVAERGGFARAARHLNVSPPAVTRAVSALEARLGVRLFHRTTRSVALTEDGTVLLDRARAILSQLDEAEHVLMGGQSAPRGELHVTAPVVFGRLHVLPVVAELLRQHRNLSARLHLADRNVRVVEEGIDAAVRIGALPDSGLTSAAVGSVRQLIVASPEYCSSRGTPTRPQDLSQHDIILGDNVRMGTQWRFGERADLFVPVEPRITVNSVDAVIAAAVAGLGIANVLSYQAAGSIASGELCSLLDDHALPPVPVSVLFHPSRSRVPAVRLFIDGMRARWAADGWR
jgi:DNA-binding transcriptional LysR family regulator